VQHLALFEAIVLVIVVAVKSLAATTVPPDEAEFEAMVQAVTALWSRGASTVRPPMYSKFEMIVSSIAMAAKFSAKETVRPKSVETVWPIMTEESSSAEETAPSNAEFEGITRQSAV
jgi:hypothetical protein